MARPSITRVIYTSARGRTVSVTATARCTVSRHIEHKVVSFRALFSQLLSPTSEVENGDVYEGGWNNGFKDGPGTYRWKDGEVDISRYSSDYRVDEGVRWSENRQRAFRLVRGNVQEEISLGEASRIARDLDLPVP